MGQQSWISSRSLFPCFNLVREII